MKRILLKSKIHRATVTDANLQYEGSVTIDENLMRAANLVEFEQVHIYNVANGNRLITYAMRGQAGSGEIVINGAAAHLVSPGHLVIICAYGEFADDEAILATPRVVHVDSANRRTN